MTITSAVVLFAVLWFLVLLVVLPIRLVTQGDAGEVVPGTHASSPHGVAVGRKAWITTGIATLLWLLIVWIIQTGRITVADLDWFGRGASAAGTAPDDGAGG